MISIVYGLYRELEFPISIAQTQANFAETERFVSPRLNEALSTATIASCSST